MKKLVGILVLFVSLSSFNLTSSNLKNELGIETCEEWATRMVEAIEQTNGCMGSSEYNRVYGILLSACLGVQQ